MMALFSCYLDPLSHFQKKLSELNLSGKTFRIRACLIILVIYMPIVIGFAVYAAVVVFSWRGFCVCGGSFCAFLLLFSSKLGREPTIYL